VSQVGRCTIVGMPGRAWVYDVLCEGAKVTRGTLPILASAFAAGKPTMVVVAVQGAPGLTVILSCRLGGLSVVEISKG
jgi:hypothetical protein